MTKEQFDNHFLQMSRRMMTPWQIFEKELAKRPGWSAEQNQNYFDCFYCGLSAAHTLLAREVIAFHDSQAATQEPKPQAVPQEPKPVTPKPNRRAKWEMLGIPGPQQVLFDILLRTLQQGDEITAENWRWLYNNSDHQPMTLEEFKHQVLEQVKDA